MLLKNGVKQWGSYEAPLAKVASAAIAALPQSMDEQSGYLCTDIANRGFSESVVIDEVFRDKESSSFSHRRERLAFEICQRCVMWRSCNKFVMPQITFPEVDAQQTVISSRQDFLEPPIQFLRFNKETRRYFTESI